MSSWWGSADWIEIIFWAGAAFAFFGRFTVPGRELNWESRYEGIVHIWLGAYIMWCWENWNPTAITFSDNSRTGYEIQWSNHRVEARFFAAVIALLTVFEIYKFMTRKAK